MIDRETYAQFKSIVSLQDKKMRDELEKMMSIYVAKFKNSNQRGVMQKGKSGTKVSLKDAFPFKSGVKVVKIFDNGFQKTVSPITSDDVRCPMCGGCEGTTILVDPQISLEEYQWSCLRDECVTINTLGAKRNYK